MTRHKNTNVGPLSGQSTAKHFAHPQPNFSAPDRHCNSMMENGYTGPKWQHRDGSQDFLRFESKGTR